MLPKLKKRTWASVIGILLIPAIIAFGVIVLEDRSYYFVSLLILAVTMLPFLLVFEHRKPMARELVLLATLSALAVAGRAAFFMLPQFKPVVAIVILTAVTLRPEAGFLVGAVSGFVSNFFFGQGPWTPWQMFSFGIVGFLAGILAVRGILPKKRWALCLYGGIATVVIYGGIMNFSSAILFGGKLTAKSLLAIYASGVPFDLIHGASTVIFLFFLANPMMEKIGRVQKKYGLLEEQHLNKK